MTTTKRRFDLSIDILSLPFTARSQPQTHESMRWITKCWNRNGQGRGVAQGVEPEVYWMHHNQFILYLCERGFVSLATLPGSPELYAGFLVGSERGIDFAFTKSEFRRDGILTRLLKAAPDHAPYYSSPPGAPDEQGRGSQAWLTAFLKKKKYRYNPFTLLELNANETENRNLQDTDASHPVYTDG